MILHIARLYTLLPVYCDNQKSYPVVYTKLAAFQDHITLSHEEKYGFVSLRINMRHVVILEKVESNYFQ